MGPAPATPVGEFALADHAPALGEHIRALADLLLAARSRAVYREVMAAVERPLLAHVLRAHRGNQLRAAQVLGLNRNTLRKRCRALGLPLPRAVRPRRPPPAALSPS